MGKTKKVKRAGRFGSRYGVGIRKRLLKIEEKQQKFYQCPFCGFKKVRRKAPGLFKCRKCQSTFAGGAYFPVTSPGSIVNKMVTQKSFLPHAKELIDTKEQREEEPGEKKEKPKREGEKEEKPKKEGEKKEKPKREGEKKGKESRKKK